MARPRFEELSRLNVFTLEEAVERLGGPKKRAQVIRLLRAHLEKGTLGSIRKGLYYVVPAGQSPKETIVDRYLAASKLSPNGVLAYHTALELLGGAYSAWNEAYVLTDRQHWSGRERFVFQGVLYRSILPPASLGKESLQYGVKVMERFGHTLRVTNHARTFVDCLDRLRYSGGVTELLNSMVGWPSLDMAEVLAYLRKLGHPTLFGRVGFVLERLRDLLPVPDSVLAELSEGVRGPSYLDTRPGQGRYVSRWKLVVPENLLDYRPGA